MEIRLSDLQAYIISLESDVQKRESATNSLNSAGITDINIFNAYKRSPGRTGLAMSFKKILSKNINHTSPILICEDDIIKNPSQTLSSIQIPNNADAVYLGIARHGYCAYINPYNNPLGAPYTDHRDRSTHPSKLVATKVDEKIYRIYNMLGAHAILIINPEYTKFLSNALDIAILSSGHQDVIRASTMPYWNIYALDIPLFYQGGSAEWITNIQLSKLGSSEMTDSLKFL